MHIQRHVVVSEVRQLEANSADKRRLPCPDRRKHPRGVKGPLTQFEISVMMNKVNALHRQPSEEKEVGCN